MRGLNSPATATPHREEVIYGDSVIRKWIEPLRRENAEVSADMDKSDPLHAAVEKAMCEAEWYSVEHTHFGDPCRAIDDCPDTPEGALAHREHRGFMICKECAVSVAVEMVRREQDDVAMLNTTVSALVNRAEAAEKERDEWAARARALDKDVEALIQERDEARKALAEKSR